MNMPPEKERPFLVVRETMRVPSRRMPWERSSGALRWTGMWYSRMKFSKTFSAAWGSKIHMVRWVPSMAGVPWPLFP